MKFLFDFDIIIYAVYVENNSCMFILKVSGYYLNTCVHVKPVNQMAKLLSFIFKASPISHTTGMELTLCYK